MKRKLFLRSILKISEVDFDENLFLYNINN